MAVISMKQLLEAGVHFGHQTRRWNPKMAKYIFTERNGIYIIDLQKTVKKVDEAYAFLRSVAEEGKSVLFVGTKKQAQEAIKEEATRAGQFYVNERWLGGMMTNFRTIQKRIARLIHAHEPVDIVLRELALVDDLVDHEIAFKIVDKGIAVDFALLVGDIDICIQDIVEDTRDAIIFYIFRTLKQTIDLAGFF